MFAPTFIAFGTLDRATLPSGDAMVTVMATPFLEAVVIAVATLACGIVVRLLVDARTPTITLRVVARPNVPRAA